MPKLILYHTRFDDLNWFNRTVLHRAAGIHGDHCILTTNHLAEHRVGGPRAHIEEVKKAVMNSVHEELATPRVWATSVSHTNCHRLVTVLWASFLTELVDNVTSTISEQSLPSKYVLKLRVWLRTSSSSHRTVGIFRVRAVSYTHLTLPTICSV